MNPRYATPSAMAMLNRHYLIAWRSNRPARARAILKHIQCLEPMYSFMEHIEPGIREIIRENFGRECNETKD